MPWLPGATTTGQELPLQVKFGVLSATALLIIVLRWFDGNYQGFIYAINSRAIVIERLLNLELTEEIQDRFKASVLWLPTIILYAGFELAAIGLAWILPPGHNNLMSFPPRRQDWVENLYLLLLAEAGIYYAFFTPGRSVWGVWNWTADVEPGLYTIRIRQPIEEARELDKKINVLPSKTMQCLSSKKEQQDGSPKQDVKEYLINQGFKELAKHEEGAKPKCHYIHYILVDEDDGRCITVPKGCPLNEITRKLILEQAKSERPKNLAKKLCKEKYKYTYQRAPEGGYTGQCHEFLGAISQAKDEEQLKINMKEAIGLVRKRVEEQAPKSEDDIVNTPHSKSKRLKALLRRRRRRKRGSEPLKKNELVS